MSFCHPLQRRGLKRVPHIASLASCLLLLGVLGCGTVHDAMPPEAEAPTETTPPAAAQAPPTAQHNTTSEISARELGSVDAAAAVTFKKIKLKKDGGDLAYSIKPQSNGAKLLDAQDKELARYILSANKLKIKDADDKTLAYIILGEDRFHIENAEQKDRLWKLQSQADGDWKLELPGDKLQTRIKRRDYGWELETASDTSLAKIKLKSGKTSIRDAQEKTLMYTKDQIRSLSMACLGLDSIKDIRVRTGLAIAVMIQQGATNDG